MSVTLGPPTPLNLEFEKGLEDRVDTTISISDESKLKVAGKSVNNIEKLTLRLPHGRDVDKLFDPEKFRVKPNRVAQFFLFKSIYEKKQLKEILLYTYDQFLLESINQDDKETIQILQTFDEEYLYVFGKDPKFVTFTGKLLNFEYPEQKTRFLEMYEGYLRASKSIANGIRVYMYYDDYVLEGRMITASTSSVSRDPGVVNFGFTMYVRKRLPVTYRTREQWKKDKDQYEFPPEQLGGILLPKTITADQATDNKKDDPPPRQMAEKVKDEELEDEEKTKQMQDTWRAPMIYPQ